MRRIDGVGTRMSQANANMISSLLKNSSSSWNACSLSRDLWDKLFCVSNLEYRMSRLESCLE